MKNYKDTILEQVKAISEKDREENQIPAALGYVWNDDKICAINPTWNPNIEAIYDRKTKVATMAY